MKPIKAAAKNLRKSERKGVVVWSLEEKKEIAKIGMTGALAATVATSFFLKNRSMKRLHVGAGAALVGFSLWHHFLYQGKKERESKEKEIAQES